MDSPWNKHFAIHRVLPFTACEYVVLFEIFCCSCPVPMWLLIDVRLIGVLVRYRMFIFITGTVSWHLSSFRLREMWFWFISSKHLHFFCHQVWIPSSRLLAEQHSTQLETKGFIASLISWRRRTIRFAERELRREALAEAVGCRTVAAA